MKQVIVLRKDLNMRKGKMIAQGAHASMGAVIPNMENADVKEWLDGRFTKIVVSVDSEQELMDIYEKAKQIGIAQCLVIDDGMTEFHGVKTPTAVAVGPAVEEVVDGITGGLKLL